MPRQTAPPTSDARRRPRVNTTLDPETIRRLDLVVALVPDVEGRSAAIRYLARTWEESRGKAP